MIVVDWGTSSFRAYRLADDGRILDRRSAPRGILTIEAGGFPTALDAEIGGWLADEPGDVVLGGMVGSRQGWVEAPYVDCPADLESIAAAAASVAWGDRRVFIAPGVVARDANGVPDVMRGEEVQILGIAEALAGEGATVCLPGTHSKWVRVEHGRITGFRTFMTGESYALYRRHSILGRLMPAEDGPHDEPAFLDGVRRCGEPGGLSHHLFGVRSRGLFGDLQPEALSSYLSGLLIGHEIREAIAAAGAGEIHLIAEAALAERYRSALSAFGRESRVHPSDVAARGLFRIGRRIGRG